MPPGVRTAVNLPSRSQRRSVEMPQPRSSAAFLIETKPVISLKSLGYHVVDPLELLRGRHRVQLEFLRSHPHYLRRMHVYVSHKHLRTPALWLAWIDSVSTREV